MSNILSLSDAMDSCRVTMGTSVDDEFHVRTTKDISRCGRTKDRVCAVNGNDSNIVSRNEWESMLEEKRLRRKQNLE